MHLKQRLTLALGVTQFLDAVSALPHLDRRAGAVCSNNFYGSLVQTLQSYPSAMVYCSQNYPINGCYVDLKKRAAASTTTSPTSKSTANSAAVATTTTANIAVTTTGAGDPTASLWTSVLHFPANTVATFCSCIETTPFCTSTTRTTRSTTPSLSMTTTSLTSIPTTTSRAPTPTTTSSTSRASTSTTTSRTSSAQTTQASSITTTSRLSSTTPSATSTSTTSMAAVCKSGSYKSGGSKYNVQCNFNFYGDGSNILGDLTGVTSMNACIDQCEGNPLCIAVDYYATSQGSGPNQVAGNCFLLSNIGVGGGSASGINAASKPAPTCNGKAITQNGHKYTVQCNQNYAGGNNILANFVGVASLADCIANCESNAACMVVDYYRTSQGTGPNQVAGNCFLLSNTNFGGGAANGVDAATKGASPSTSSTTRSTSSSTAKSSTRSSSASITSSSYPTIATTTSSSVLTTTSSSISTTSSSISTTSSSMTTSSSSMSSTSTTSSVPTCTPSTYTASPHQDTFQILCGTSFYADDESIYQTYGLVYSLSQCIDMCDGFTDISQQQTLPCYGVNWNPDTLKCYILATVNNGQSPNAGLDAAYRIIGSTSTTTNAVTTTTASITFSSLTSTSSPSGSSLSSTTSSSPTSILTTTTSSSTTVSATTSSSSSQPTLCTTQCNLQTVFDTAGGTYTSVSETCQEIDFGFNSVAGNTLKGINYDNLNDCQAIEQCAQDTSSYGGVAFRIYYGNAYRNGVGWRCDISRNAYSVSSAQNQFNAQTGNQYIYVLQGGNSGSGGASNIATNTPSVYIPSTSTTTPFTTTASATTTNTMTVSTTTADTTSASTNSASCATATGFIIQPNINYWGGSNQLPYYYNIASIDACVALCDQYVGSTPCVAVDWYSGNEICYLLWNTGNGFQSNSAVTAAARPGCGISSTSPTTPVTSTVVSTTIATTSSTTTASTTTASSTTASITSSTSTTSTNNLPSCATATGYVVQANTNYFGGSNLLTTYHSIGSMSACTALCDQYTGATPCAIVDYYRAIGDCYLLSSSSSGVSSNNDVDAAYRPGCGLDPNACLDPTCNAPSVESVGYGRDYVYNKIQQGCGQVAVGFATFSPAFWDAGQGDCYSIQRCADWALTNNALAFQVYTATTDNTWHCDIQSDRFYGSYSPNNNVRQYYQYSLR